jgi:hypothetical protein
MPTFHSEKDDHPMTRRPSFLLTPLLAVLTAMVPVAQVTALALTTTSTPAFEESIGGFDNGDGGGGGGCDGGWGDGGGSEDWMDAIMETGCIPEMYDYYMLPDASTPAAEPSTAAANDTWGPGDDAPAVAPDNCDYYDWTRDPWIYLMWGCG